MTFDDVTAWALPLLDAVQCINPWWVLAGLLAYLLYAVLLWAFTWVFYVFTMGTIWAQHQVGGKTAALVGAALKVAWWLNVALNYTVMTVLFFELPRRGEPNVSARLLRLRRHSGQNWRQRLADKLATLWLDPFDPTGRHV